MQMVLATNNPHKVEEIQALLAEWNADVRPLRDHPEIPEPPEEEDTFEGNALSKARFVHGYTGGWVMADDSGLEVDALDGAPGVHSKRFTPEATAESNNAHLLERLDGVAERNARFVCAVALVSPDGTAVTFRGTCEGKIGDVPKGSNGFGYDPIFLPEGQGGRTMAELDPSVKNRIGHRGSAFGQVRDHLRIKGRLTQQSPD